MGIFRIIKRSDGNFQFNLIAGNGEIILTSEGYTTKQSCLNGVNSVMKNSQYDINFDRRTAVNEKYYFVLKARNGEIIGRSQLYASQAGRENGINSVKANAINSSVEE